MIVGAGVLAQAFERSGISWDDVTILAAGVSSSSEDRPSAFERERELILSVPTDQLVVYFSTLSLHDPMKKDSLYVRHKQAMEVLIQQRFPKYLIMRLPIVVSRENNPNQLFGYLRSKIKNKERLFIFRHATRYLLDVEDVPVACRLILDKSDRSQQLINVGFSQSVSMAEIAERLLENIPDLDIEFVEEGRSYEVDFSRFEELSEGVAMKSRNPEAIIDEFIKSI